MNKETFLKELSAKLKANNYKDKENLVNYYDELIEEAKESGKNEKKVIAELGSIDEILKEINIIEKIEKAKEKTTPTNGIKALIAALSIFSLPLLIPLAIVGVALLIAVMAIIFSGIMVIGALIFSAIIIPFALIWQMANGAIPLPSFIFGLGISLILIGLFYALIKVSIKGSKHLGESFFEYLAKLVNKKRGVKKDE